MIRICRKWRIERNRSVKKKVADRISSLAAEQEPSISSMVRSKKNYHELRAVPTKKNHSRHEKGPSNFFPS